MEYIKTLLKKSGWISILESLVIAILGIVLVCMPEVTVRIIATILGVVFIIVGIFKLIRYFAEKGASNFYNYDLIYGLTAIVIGIVAMVYMNEIGSVFRIMIGIWILYTAILRINTSIQLKKVNNKIWIYSLILAIIMFACGLFVILNRGAIIITIGSIMIGYSIIDIIEDIIFMKNLKEF